MPIPTSVIFDELEFESFLHPLSTTPAYRAVFGPYQLEVALLANRWFQQSWMITGVVNSGRTLAMVDGELPLEVASKEQALALLSYFVGSYIPEQFKPPWLRIGERMTSHLPWARS